MKNIINLAEKLCGTKCVRYSSGISRSKNQTWMKYGKRKQDIGERIPLPEVKGDILLGIHPVQAALHSGKRSLFTAFFKAGVCNDRLNKLRSQCEEKGVEILEVTGPVLDSLSGNIPHQGVCLDASPLKLKNISVEAEIVSEKLINSKGEPQVWVLPYKVKDTMNMGAILRSCFYFGADKILMPAHYSSALNPVVSKASAGALEVMDIQSLAYESTMTKCFKRWKDAGGTVVGSTGDENHEKVLHLHKFSTNRPTLLIIGNEAEGISEKVSKYCDALLCIPNFQTTTSNSESFCVDSLNVSVATGVLLHSIVMSRHRNR